MTRGVKMENNNMDQKTDVEEGHNPMKMMGICLLLAIGAIWIFRLPSDYFFYLLILMCPLMHMMGGHGRHH